MLKIGTGVERYVFLNLNVLGESYVNVMSRYGRFQRFHSAQIHSYQCVGQCDISDKLLLFYLPKTLPTLSKGYSES